MDQIIITMLMMLVGVLVGVLFCQLVMANAAEKREISQREKRLQYAASGVFMGCAFFCASHRLCQGDIYGGLFVLFGLMLLAMYAIQDRIEFAVYSFLLCGGNIGLVLLKALAFVFEKEWMQLLVFIPVTVGIYLILKYVGNKIERWMGVGDSEILFAIYLLCGPEGILQAIFLSAFIGLLMYMPLVVTKKMKLCEQIPLAPVLYLGALLYFAL